MKLFVVPLLVVVSFLLVSCGTKTIRVVEETFPDGKEKKVVYYSDNEAHEKLREETYYPNAKMESEGAFVNGERDGIWRFWYQNGNLWSEGEFSNGKANGVRKVYYENGQLRYRGEYSNDAKSGKWEFYDENGRKVNEEKY
jgi:antitoxin component YwqK of YwqJK toxin-antitoxin module